MSRISTILIVSVSLLITACGESEEGPKGRPSPGGGTSAEAAMPAELLSKIATLDIAGFKRVSDRIVGNTIAAPTFDALKANGQGQKVRVMVEVTRRERAGVSTLDALKDDRKSLTMHLPPKLASSDGLVLDVKSTTTGSDPSLQVYYLGFIKNPGKMTAHGIDLYCDHGDYRLTLRAMGKGSTRKADDQQSLAKLLPPAEMRRALASVHAALNRALD